MYGKVQGVYHVGWCVRWGGALTGGVGVERGRDSGVVAGAELPHMHRLTGHIEQACGFSPVWVRSCGATSLFWANRLRSTTGTSSKRTACRRCGSARAGQRRSCWRTAPGTSSKRAASRPCTITPIAGVAPAPPDGTLDALLANCLRRWGVGRPVVRLPPREGDALASPRAC